MASFTLENNPINNSDKICMCKFAFYDSIIFFPCSLEHTQDVNHSFSVV